MSDNCEWQNSTTASVASGFSPVTVLKLRKSYADSASLGCPENLNLWKMCVCVHLQGWEIGQKSLISLFLELRLGKFNCDPSAICLTKPWDKQLITDVCYIGLNHLGLGIDLPLRWASESVCMQRCFLVCSVCKWSSYMHVCMTHAVIMGKSVHITDVKTCWRSVTAHGRDVFLIWQIEYQRTHL